MPIVEKTIPYRVDYLNESLSTLKTLSNVAQVEAKKLSNSENYPHFDFAWDYSFDHETLYLTVILAYLDPYDCKPGDLVYSPEWKDSRIKIPGKSFFAEPTLVAPGEAPPIHPNLGLELGFEQELIVAKQMRGSKFPFDTELLVFDKYYKPW